MEVCNTALSLFQPSKSQLCWSFLWAYTFAGFFFQSVLNFLRNYLSSYLFTCWYYLPVISIPIACFFSAYFSFNVFSFIIPWLQWLPLLWGVYTCSECFPTQKSQKHSGLFCLGRLMPQTYNLFYFLLKAPCSN